MTAPAEPSPAIGAMLARIVRKYAPGLVYAGLHTFRVDSVSGGRVDLRPSGSRIFGPQRAVYQWPGVAGSQAIPQAGSEVVLAFLDNDPARPALVLFQPLAVTGGKPTEVKIDGTKVEIGPTSSDVELAGGGNGIARLADTVDCGTLSAALAGPSVVLTWIPPGGGAPVTSPPAIPMVGKINSASSKGTCG